MGCICQVEGEDLQQRGGEAVDSEEEGTYPVHHEDMLFVVILCGYAPLYACSPQMTSLWMIVASLLRGKSIGMTSQTRKDCISCLLSSAVCTHGCYCLLFHCLVPRALREAQDIFGLDFDPVELDRIMEESYLSSDEEEEGLEEV